MVLFYKGQMAQGCNSRRNSRTPKGIVSNCHCVFYVRRSGRTSIITAGGGWHWRLASTVGRVVTRQDCSPGFNPAYGLLAHNCALTFQESLSGGVLRASSVFGVNLTPRTQVN